MSIYVVKDADISLKLNQDGNFEPVDIPVSVDLKLLDEKLYNQLDLGGRSRWRTVSFLESTKETFRFQLYLRPASNIVTAQGPAIHKFIEAHQTKKLKMNFDARFENGFQLTYEMKTRFDRYAYRSGMSERLRYFEALPRSDDQNQSTKLFQTNQLYTGKYSLEIISRKAFPLEDNSVREATPMLKGFLEEGNYSDFAIVAGNGSRIPCHKVFLGARSPVLDRMLQMDCKETQEKCVKMQASEEGVKALLKYVYYGDLEDAFRSLNIAMELLELAHVYDIKLLEEAVKNIFLKRSDGWLDMDDLLNLFFATVGKSGLERVKEKAIQLIKSRKNELNESTVFQELVKRDPNEVTEFFKSFL